jgi:FtsZ-binding cell division protein ZapB
MSGYISLLLFFAMEMYEMKKILIAAALVFYVAITLCSTGFAEESLIIDETGNVGIGETEPDHALVVVEDDSANALHVTNSYSTTSGSNNTIFLKNTTSGYKSYGIYNYIYGDTTYSYGGFNHLRGDATSSYGSYNYINGDSTNRSVGSFNHLSGDSYYLYGTYSKIDGDATSLYGSYNNITSGSASYSYGNSNQISGSATYKYGNYNYCSGSGTTTYGSYNRAAGSATNKYGIYNRVSGSNKKYGIYNRVSGSGYNCGSYNRVVGYGTKNVGSYSRASGSATVNYGVYGFASGATTNYAGYFYGNVYGTANASFASFTDRTPFYEGDALAEISKISGKNGEIDHSTLPAFAHVTKKLPVFEESELVEIDQDQAFETVMVERAKTVETTNDAGETEISKVKKGTKIESKGYNIEDGKIVEVIEETPIYETELVETKRIKDDVYFDETTGRVFQTIGDGHIYERDGKVYQEIHKGLEVEEQRDLGAMISILTVAVQQLNEKNETLTTENDQLKSQNTQLENRLSEIEELIASMAKS